MAEKPQASRRRPQRAPRSKTPDKHGQVTHVRYCAAVVQRICERLAQGESVFQLGNGKGMPACSTVYAWQRRYPDFAEKVAQAREQGADYLAGRALEVAAGSTKETVQQGRIELPTSALPNQYRIPPILRCGTFLLDNHSSEIAVCAM